MHDVNVSFAFVHQMPTFNLGLKVALFLSGFTLCYIKIFAGNL